MTLPFIILLEDIKGDGTHNHIDMIYICNALNEEFCLQECEVSKIGWFTSEQIKHLDTFDNVRMTVAKALEFITANPILGE